MTTSSNITDQHKAGYDKFFQRDDKGALVFCGQHVPTLLHEMTDTNNGQPIYLLGTDIIKFQADAALKALKASETKATYAIKANSNTEILKILAKKKIGAEIASVEELKLALKSGFDPEDIVADGIGKSKEYFELALKHGVGTLNCNDKDDLELLNTVAGNMNMSHVKVGIRVTPGTKGGEVAGISTGDNESKFGIPIEDAADIYKNNPYKNLDLVGIHCHLGSNIKDVKTFEEGYNRVTDLAIELNNSKHKIEYLDIGGGVGAPYSPYGALGIEPSEDDKKLVNIEQYGEVVKQQKEKLQDAGLENPKLISELGRYYVAPAELYLAQVTGTNTKGEHTHVTTTGHMGHLIRTALYDAPNIAFPLVDRPDAETYGKNTELVGSMCESDDKLVLAAEGMQKQEIGDYIAVPSAGAYNPMMQLDTYNQFGTCGTILCHDDGQAYMVERSVKGDEYMKLRNDDIEKTAHPGDLKTQDRAFTFAQDKEIETTMGAKIGGKLVELGQFFSELMEGRQKGITR